MKKLYSLAAVFASALVTSTASAAVGCGAPGAAPCPAPEPGSFALLGLGLVGLVATRLMKRQ